MNAREDTALSPNATPHITCARRAFSHRNATSSYRGAASVLRAAYERNAARMRASTRVVARDDNTHFITSLTSRDEATPNFCINMVADFKLTHHNRWQYTSCNIPPET